MKTISSLVLIPGKRSQKRERNVKMRWECNIAVFVTIFHTIFRSMLMFQGPGPWPAPGSHQATKMSREFSKGSELAVATMRACAFTLLSYVFWLCSCPFTFPGPGTRIWDPRFISAELLKLVRVRRPQVLSPSKKSSTSWVLPIPSSHLSATSSNPPEMFLIGDLIRRDRPPQAATGCQRAADILVPEPFKSIENYRNTEKSM